jgi:Na+-translocating ferredoxin:NAD+ oxidoreductase subunit D
MKFTFHVSPSIKNTLSTQRIMAELTASLLVVFVVACVFYGIHYGANVALQAILLLACSLITTLVCEFAFAKIMKKDVKSFLKNSFGWVTSIIFTLMVPVTMIPYAVIIATAFAIIFGKLLFGGFGQNIFNPAAVGRAVIFAAFTGVSTNIITSATPTTVMASTYNWLPANATVLEAFLDQFGGFTGLALGTYAGAIGETCTILILIIGVILSVRQIIDWRVPVVYLGTIFVLTAVIALISGIGSYHGIPAVIWYPVLHLVTGGVVFGGVFMLTDPVTSPTSASGRVMFAMGAAIITVLIRMKANLPEGCLYSILLMNMFTPYIESLFDGKQLDLVKKSKIGFICLAIIGLAISFYAASSIEKVESTAMNESIVQEVTL